MDQYNEYGQGAGDELIEQGGEAAHKAKRAARAARNLNKSKAAQAGKSAGKAAGKALSKAAGGAAQAAGEGLSSLGALIFAHPVIALIVIVCLAFIFLLAFAYTNNTTVFSVFLKLDAMANLEDTKERVANTLGDTEDWRFHYNKLLPEEQFDYIYYGNQPPGSDNDKPYETQATEQVDGLYHYIRDAYLAAQNAFVSDLGNLNQYHYDFFAGEGAIKATIKEFEKANYGGQTGESNGTQTNEQTMTTEEIIQWINDKGISVTEPYATALQYLKDSAVFQQDGAEKTYYDRIIKFRNGITQYPYQKELIKNFDYLVLEESDVEGEDPILKERYVLNLDLSYLANHETLVGDIAIDGRFNKESEITSIITYLIAGMDIATCGISPSGGYLDFLSATIGNEDVFDPAMKFQGNHSLLGLLSSLVTGVNEYTLYLPANGPVRFQMMAADGSKINSPDFQENIAILDTTACEVKRLDGTKRAGAGPFGEDVYEYYIVVKNPIDTDRLLWSMFVSDAARSYTYQGLFQNQVHKYQGSYYEVYSMFEPGSAALEKGFFSKLQRFFASFSADKGLARAKSADATEIRRYLYGLDYYERTDPETFNYFSDAWNEADNNKDTAEYKKMLKNAYFVDRNRDGEINGDDYYGLLNETYYTYQMRPLYKCDYHNSNFGIEHMKAKHNLMHDGYGVSFEELSENPFKCLYHRIFEGDNSECTFCVKKAGSLECSCSSSGLNCTEWASTWSPQCPGCEKLGACGALAQRSTGGKIKIEYVRNPKPEFTPIISITEEEYKEHINNDAELYYTESTLGESLSELEGNNKVDLKTNYNRQGWGARKDDPDAPLGAPARYYFSTYEFWGEYALSEDWSDTKLTGEAVDSDDSWEKGSADLIEFTPNEAVVQEFETLQEVAEEENRQAWQDWYDAKNKGEDAVGNYRAVSLLSAIYKRKYFYHNLLNMDSYYSGYYKEENFDRPLASEFAKIDGTLDTDKFDDAYSSENEEDTAFFKGSASPSP